MFNIKNFLISNLIILTVALQSPKANSASYYTSKDFFEWRAKLNKENPNDYKSSKFCKSLIGSSVVFESKVISIDKNGTINADMDFDSILSIPEINLFLKDPDESEDLKSGQTIKYSGNISACLYKKASGVLFLNIANGELQLHY